MKNTFLIFFLLACVSMNAQKYSENISVNFFLLDECRISQNISGEINTVYNEFNEGPFSFFCYFTSETSTESKIENFIKKFKLKVPFFTDYKKKKATLYGATIAPQVVVYDEINKKILYTGRIDNSFDEIGSRRRVITEKDLRNVLAAIKNQQDIKEKETKAIGCIINTI